MSQYFPVLSELPQSDQDELRRIFIKIGQSAFTFNAFGAYVDGSDSKNWKNLYSANLLGAEEITADEDNYIIARLKYVWNTIYETDSSGLITNCESLLVPTPGAEGPYTNGGVGYRTGCICLVLNDNETGLGATYLNVGTSLVCDFRKLVTGPLSANQLLNTGGLAIHGASSALAKTVNTIYFLVDGYISSVAAADMAALAGTVTNAKFNVYVFTVQFNGTLASYMGTESATLGGIVFPEIPSGKAVIGFVIINPTGTGNFVGGTTELDDATVVPNAVYIDTPYPYLPALNLL